MIVAHSLLYVVMERAELLAVDHAESADALLTDTPVAGVSRINRYDASAQR